MANGDETKDNKKIASTVDKANNDKSVIENFSMGGIDSQITTGTNKYGAKVQVLTHKKDGQHAGETYDKAAIKKFRNQVAHNKKVKESQDFAREVQEMNPDQKKNKDDVAIGTFKKPDNIVK